MTQTLAKGSGFGPYRLEEKLGAGGMGAVWKALDTRLERHVALKFLAPNLTGDPLSLARFRREGRVVARMNHPNVLTVYEAGVEGGIPYICTEIVDGDDLHSLLGKTGRFSAGRVQDVGIQLLRALESVHALGIVHRDIKPHNIMLRADGILKILDFGIARPDDETAISAPGSISGTPRYLAPELLECREPDARSDLFSIGAVLYELLTGVPAFGGKTTPQVIRAIMQDSPEPLPEDTPLTRAIMKALRKAPEQRFQSALEMREAILQKFEGDCDSTTTVTQAAESFPPPIPFQLPSVMVAPLTAEESLSGMAEAVHLEVNIRLGLCPFIRLLQPHQKSPQDSGDYLLRIDLRRLEEGIKVRFHLVDTKADREVVRKVLEVRDKLHLAEDQCAHFVGEAFTSHFERGRKGLNGSPQEDIEKIVSELWFGDFHSLTQSLSEMEALLGRYTESAALYGRVANLLITASSFHGAEMDETLRHRSIECARRALEIDESEPFAHLALAKSLVRLREADWERALEHWKESFKRAPGELWVQTFRAFYDIETGRPEMSVKRAEKLLEQSPDELMVLPVMSLGSLCAGRFHKALEWGERLLRSRPQDSLGLCLVFYSDLYLGKIERALLFAAYLRKQLREAKDEGRDDPLLEALVLLADCFEHPESAAARLPLLLQTSGRMSTRVLLTACAVLKNEELAKQCLAFLKKYSYRNLPLLDVDPYIQEQFAGRDWYIDRVRALTAG